VRDAFDKDDDVPVDITKAMRSTSPLARVDLPEPGDNVIPDAVGADEHHEEDKKNLSPEGSGDAPVDLPY
jgi:hypothetical protein